MAAILRHVLSYQTTPISPHELALALYFFKLVSHDYSELNCTKIETARSLTNFKIDKGFCLIDLLLLYGFWFHTCDWTTDLLS